MSSTSEKEPTEQASKKPPKRYWSATEPFFDFRASHWVEIFLTIALIGVGVAQFVVYWRQAGIMKTQADIASTQNKITIAGERAFVHFGNYELQIWKDRSGSTKFVVAIALNNSGNTATKGLELHIKCAPSSENIPEPWVLLSDSSEKERIPQIMAPHQSIKTYCAFPLEDIRQVIAGKARTYLLGDISYRDRLNENELHKTQFAFELFNIGIVDPPPNAPESVLPRVVIGSIEPRGRHNCADEDCPNN